MTPAIDTGPFFALARLARPAGYFTALTLYVAVGAAATIIFPPLGVVFLLPVAFAIIAVAPPLKAVPRKLVFTLLLVGALLLPLWPSYLFIKLGPTPALTPSRLVFYMVSALWAYDMTFSPLRRAQFIYAVRKSGAVAGLFFALFALGFLSLPFAEGRAVAAPEFFRQAMIWLAPFCATITYCRRQREFVALIKAATIAAVIVALIAIGEFATRQLLANALAPLVGDDAEWLRNVQALKTRDGVFRAQSTHTHPLSLGEHLSFAAPFAAAFFFSARTMRGRMIWFASLAAIVAAAIATNSRAAAIVLVLSLGAMALMLAWRALRRTSASHWRPLAGLAILACVVVSPVAVVGVAGVIAGKGGVSASNSTQSRIDQIEMALPKIMKRPIGGYGTGRAARVLGYWGRTLTLDNFYLSLALDLGLPGPLTFLAMLAAWAFAALKRSGAAHPHLGVLYLACAASAISFALDRAIISLTGNLAIVYFMMAAFAGASVTFSRRRCRNRA
ncbi:MAG: hypothetical protein A3E01_08600 [Gammaproteobacteria bacterium RIFCSPHIGHO2_12_FULL_63_22]|nr:MAG: hypothetical protein A3E01_08600 [Gammaproteobacteria bacterium RIFCSPHIGHO2_12_FULL_63_22]